MSRILSSGFELNSFILEGFQTLTNPPSISNTIIRSGKYSLDCKAEAQSVKAVLSSTGISAIYLRVYIYLVAYPPSSEADLVGIQQDDFTAYAQVVVNPSGQIRVINGNNGAVGAVNAVPLNQWHMVEVYLNVANISSSIITYKFDGAQIGTGTYNLTGLNQAGIKQIDLGFDYLDSNALTSGEALFDDLAVNDLTGNFQNSFPGEGSIIHLQPNAAGDSNTFATQTGGVAGSSNNFTRVSEVTPDDATSFNGSNTLNQEDLFKCTSNFISSSANINVVSVGSRFANNVADATTAIKIELEKSSGGVKAQSASIIPNTTIYNTNTVADPRTYPLTVYQTPDNQNWTSANLNTIEIGYKIVTGGTNAINVSTTWVLVEYAPSTNSTIVTGNAPQPQIINQVDMV